MTKTGLLREGQIILITFIHYLYLYLLIAIYYLILINLKELEHSFPKIT